MLAEFAVPAMSVGALAALAAGGLAALAGQPASWAAATGLALGVPLSLLGGLYAVLIATEKVPAGVFTTAALYWLVGFPLAMLAHAAATSWVFTGRPGLPTEPLLQFLAYQGLLSMGFAIGFMWAHEQFGRRWWPRIRDHNVYAYRIVEEYKTSATAMHEAERASAEARRERKRQRAKARYG